MMLIKRMLKLREELGGPGMVSLALLLAGVFFLAFTLHPLELRNKDLERQLLQGASRASANAESTPAAKLAAFYSFFESSEQTTDRLAKLHDIARATGVEMRSAQYQMQNTGTAMERYEMTLPLTGTYAQIRSFLRQALQDIPVLSLDQVNFRRKGAEDTAVHAEVRLSIYRMKR